MFRTPGRKLLWAYALLLLVAAVGYARYDTYMMDGDGTAFMDIAQYMNTHRAGLAINGYWNPGYPAVLAVAERLTPPTLWRELVLVRYVNVVIFGLAMLGTLAFTTSLAEARTRQSEPLLFALPDGALHLLGLALLAMSLGRELPVAAPRSDTLLFALLMTAGSLLVRGLQAPQKVWIPAVLGLVLGTAYLTKSFAFLPSVFLVLAWFLASMLHAKARRRSGLLGTTLFAVLFALVAGPYIIAITRQLGHFTTGESARLNYAFFVDLTGRWHEWYHHDLGHALGVFQHPETVLANAPPVFSYAAHPQGTFPLWFDPAWWTLGIKPHVWPKGHALRLARNLVVFLRYLLGRPEIFVLLGVLLAAGAVWPRMRRGKGLAAVWRTEIWFIAPLLWGLLMFAIYLPIDLQDRYLTAPLLLVLLPIFASLRTPDRNERGPKFTGGSLPGLGSALVALFAGILLVQAVTYLAEKRRHIAPEEQSHPGYSSEIFNAAAGLQALGVRPGDKVACMGDKACYTDFYWARLAGAQIEGEVETPGEADPITVWNEAKNKDAITKPLAGLGLSYIVSLFPNSMSKPAGWIQLGGSNFFAYPLQGPVSDAETARVADSRATP